MTGLSFRMARLRFGRCLALLATAGLYATAAYADRSPLALLALRPTDSTMAGTKLDLLPESQRLRTLAENALEAISGYSVLHHAELRQQLGTGYLVATFECSSEPACVSRVANPLRNLGIDRVLVADWTAEGENTRIRFRLIDISQGRLVDEVTLTAPRAELDSLKPWRAPFERLFDDTGSVELVSNVTDFACTMDGAPCTRDPNGVTKLREGEHVVELTKEGYKPTVRTLTVRRGGKERVALPLERLPIQLQAAPDPTSRTPTFKEGEPGFQVKPFGVLALTAISDNQNTGDTDDFFALPPMQRNYKWHATILPMPALIGVGAAADNVVPGWKFHGVVAADWFLSFTPRIRQGYLEIIADRVGFKATLGYGKSLLNSLTSGTLTWPLGYGDLVPLLVGVTLTQSIGPFIVEAFGGKPYSSYTLFGTIDSSATLPVGAAHLAYINQRVSGLLYDSPFPLTIGVSGLVGKERDGAGEANAAKALMATATPKVEDLLIWIGSFEFFVPAGTLGSLAGELYVGRGVGFAYGVPFQRVLLDLDTGEHHAMLSYGGWVQLCFRPVRFFEVRAIAGMDRIGGGPYVGVLLNGAPVIQSNELYALNADFYVIKNVMIGIQGHFRISRYDSGVSQLLGGAFQARVTF